MNNSLPPNTDAAPAELIQLGHYELHDCIGRGGMGLVYRARDTRLDRQVAIKCLRTELFEHHYVERFKREALLLAKLNHPNIVQIYDFIEAPDQLALVMELVEGQNLQLHLREHIVPFAQRMRWLTEIAQGLAVAHDAGIIHRDLKAENILINQRQVAKITDLGIAKSQDYNATLTDHVAGSYCSMSPEQAMGEPLDFKSDLFSFGILAYQLLCGAHPFGDTNNKLQLMQRIISHPPIAPGKHNPNLPAEINDLLGQLLSKDPAKRPDNTHWVAAQLEKLSHLQMANDFVSDDTQAIIPNGSAANQSNVKNTGINSSVRTQDHPTFETRFVAINTAPKKSRWLPIKNYLLENKISVSFGVFSVLLLAAVGAWQLQPKPPKYIAVIPPKLTAEGMQESQQELIKGAVFDAIQQSVIQLDGYYLIPRDEIADVNGDNETVRRATAADELIATGIQCRIESCTIKFERLTPENGGRLKVKDTKSIDVLVDNYLSVAAIVENETGKIYEDNTTNIFEGINADEYATFLKENKSLRHKGATTELLSIIERFGKKTKHLAAVQTLYREAALDIYHDTKDPSILDKLSTFLHDAPRNDSFFYLNNLFRLSIAQNKYHTAEQIIAQIRETNIAPSDIYELHAYSEMSKNNYASAIDFYVKAIKTKPTATNLTNLANAYWFYGDLTQARAYLTRALLLSPKYYKALTISGLIDLTDGNIQQAESAFIQVLSQRPDDIGNIGNLGLCYLLTGRYDEADKLYSTVNYTPQRTLTVLLNKADAKNLAGKTQESIELYKELVNSTKNISQSNESIRNLSQAYAHIGEYNEALRALKKLEERDPQNIETIYTAALVHTLANNYASALFNIENSLKGGINKIWFNFSWFNRLCSEKKFVVLMQEYHKGHDRCPPLEN